MTPFYFGLGKRRLFGLYTPPAGPPPAGRPRGSTGGSTGGRTGGRAVLLCQPWGPEYIHAHRPVRHLADMLAENGCHTLRFDYYGSGDSAGDAEAVDLAGWEADIEQAIEELRTIADVSRVTLIGLRLGADLAARVAVRLGTEVEALVLWDPLISGADYLGDLYQAGHLWPTPRRRLPVRPAARGGGHEILGYPLTDALTRDFRQLDLLPTVPMLPDRTLVLMAAQIPARARLEEALAERSPQPVALEPSDELPAWIDHWPHHALPIRSMQRIVQWVA